MSRAPAPLGCMLHTYIERSVHRGRISEASSELCFTGVCEWNTRSAEVDGACPRAVKVCDAGDFLNFFMGDFITGAMRN